MFIVIFLKATILLILLMMMSITFDNVGGSQHLVDTLLATSDDPKDVVCVYSNKHSLKNKELKLKQINHPVEFNNLF